MADSNARRTERRKQKRELNPVICGCGCGTVITNDHTGRKKFVNKKHANKFFKATHKKVVEKIKKKEKPVHVFKKRVNIKILNVSIAIDRACDRAVRSAWERATPKEKIIIEQRNQHMVFGKSP